MLKHFVPALTELRERFGEEEGIKRAMGFLALQISEVTEREFINLFEKAGWDLSATDIQDLLGQMLKWFESENVFTLTQRLVPSLADGSGELIVKAMNNPSMQEYMERLKSDGQLIRSGLY